MDKNDVIQVLEAEREELLKKLQSLEVTILTLKQSLAITPMTNEDKGVNGHTVEQNNNSNASKYRGYFTAKSNRDKVAAILKGESRFLHMREIIKIAQTLEPKADKEKLAKQIQQGVYGLKNMDNPPLVTKTINNVNMNTFWGSKNWVDANGEIKPEYMYDEKQIVGNKTESIEI